jgi:hypothetical protein
MPVGSGLAAQFAYKEEAVKNTRAVPDHWLEFVNEGVKATRPRIDRTGLRAGRRTLTGWAPGNTGAGGSVSFEMVPQSTASLLKLCIGGVVTSGSGPYTHTITPGDLKTFTAQFGKPDTGGVVRPFDYVGSMIESWKISCDATGDGSMLMFEAAFQAFEERLAEVLATPSYPTITSWTSVQASLTIAGSAYCVDSFEIAGENALRVNYEACAATAGKPNITENGRRVYSGTLVSDFKDLTAYNRFVNGTEAALVITVNAGASAQLTITSNVRFDGETPNVTGPDVLKQSLPFVCVGTTDAAVLTAVVINGDSAP